jgi:ribokinase
MAKIVVVGSINMDMVVTTQKLPSLGETLIGSGFSTQPGGKGANQAVAVAKLGGKVSMVGCVGEDAFGRELINNLNLNGVNTVSVEAINGQSTGIAMVVVLDGNNSIIVSPGANSLLTPTKIEMIEELIKDSCIVMIQLEIPLDTVEKTIDIAKKHGVKVLLNPAPARDLSDNMLAKVDIFTPNESECEAITGLPIRNIEDGKKAVNMLIEKGIPQVIVTMGCNGVVYNNGSDVVHAKVPDVNAVDTTAAGDSFSGAIAYAMSIGKSIDEAVKLANIVGMLTVLKKGAQDAIPTMTDVERYYEKSMWND